MFLYPGGNDTNKYCILCTECLKSCPNNTMRWGVRPPLKDLWANKAFSFDESFNIIALLGVSSIAPIMLIKWVGNLEDALPAMDPPYPGIIAKTLLYILGLLAAILLITGYSWIISRATSAEEGFKGWKHYANIYATALVPLPLMKLIADIIDHILRNGSSVFWVVVNFILDFPRGSPDATGYEVVSPLALNDPVINFGIQALLLTLGFFASTFVIRKLYINWEPQRKFSSEAEAKTALLMMLGLSFAITMFNLWALSGPAVA
jgi:ferredoxin